MTTLTNLAIAGLFVLSVAPQTRPAPPAPDPVQPRTKLVVLVVVDQMRVDYLKYYDAKISGGFRRLQTGAVYTQAFYPYASTETAQGHSTMVTGESPSVSGIVGDSWYDRGRKGPAVAAGESPDHPLIGGAARGGSPEQLLVPTVGDQMKKRDRRSLVLAASWKRYCAMLMAGRHGDAGYWLDESTGQMVTSDYYLQAYPSWVDAFNATDPTKAYFGKDWLGHKFSTRPQPDAMFRARVKESPYGNDILLDFVTRLVNNTPLGQDSVPDFLGVSFSSVDAVGHAYGPFTPELDDTFLQQDRQLGLFMQALDARVGPGNWTMALVADHGVAELPEKVKARGGDAGRIDAVKLRAAVAHDLTVRVGPDAERLIEAVESPEFYLDYAEAGRRGIDAPTLERAVADVAMKQPGIAKAYTRNEIMSAAPNSDPILRAIAEGFYPGRSGDIYLVVKPNYIFRGATGTSHGTPYEYDQHVPLIFYGAGIVPGTHNERVVINDLAPTLAYLADAQMPALPGRVLSNALALKR